MNKIILGTITLFLILFASCTKFEKFESKKLSDAPTVSLAIEEVKDSSVVVSFVSTSTGFISFVLIEGVANEKPDSAALIQLNVEALQDGSYEVIASGEKTMYEFTGLVQNSVYEVFAVAQNDDGVLSNVSDALMIKTTDINNPVLVLDDVSPAISTKALEALDMKVTLTFDEPISEADASKFSFTYLTEGVNAPADSATVNPKNPYQVIVSQSRAAHAMDYIFLSYSEGAVLDIVGNPVEALASGVDDEDSPVGLYWRAISNPFALDKDKFVPKNGEAVSDPDFVIEFKAPVAVKNKAKDGSIKLIVVGAGVKSIYEVPAANITLGDDKKTIQVEKPFSPTFGEMIYIEIAAGTFTDNFGNPNIIIESGIDGIAGVDDPITKIGWLISYGYTIDMVIGNYTFDGINHPNPDYGTDKSFDVEIVADPDNDDQVLILGFYGSETPIPAVFNGDFATLTVTPPEDDFLLGDIFNDGGETYFWSDDAEVFVLNIQANGDLITDPAYFLDVYWVSADETEEYFVNVFVESTWTKHTGGKAKQNNILKSKPINSVSRYGIIK
ncbi:MAG TPA: hypothetical protein VJY41_08235 [Prolixibacteraceae bacterium]|nr:hypothetical protein [Prolixibacteraceae bacterium]